MSCSYRNSYDYLLFSVYFFLVALQSSGKLVYCFFSITDCAVELQGSHYYPEEYLDMQRLFGLLGPQKKKKKRYIRYVKI